MPKTRRLLNKEITLSAALNDESNILQKLTYWEKRDRLYDHVLRHSESIQAITAHHLGLGNSSACIISRPQEWLHGSFNLCVPMTIEDWKKRIMIRFPLSYRVGEEVCPGNGDEKIRCEAATYAWLEENCPTVPIPQLYGFGLSTGRQFTCVRNLSFVCRWYYNVRCAVRRWLGYAVPSRYVPHQTNDHHLKELDLGYVLIEYIEDDRGKMLSTTWDEQRHDAERRTNLFRSLSRILLDIARIELPRIGSFTIDDDGMLSLTNRPLNVEIQDYENQGIPTGIPRDYTYATTDSYVTDLLSFHENRLRFQPNGATHEADCVYQMCALTLMRALSTHFMRRDLRRGPFVLDFTDLHKSNIFVDDQWNITCLVDLEWACSHPIEMVQPPWWLTDRSLDTLKREEYDPIRSEFMQALKLEEAECIKIRRDNFLKGQKHNSLQLSTVMQQSWDSGTFFFVWAVQSCSCLCGLFYEHIQPLFAKNHLDDDNPFFTIMMRYTSTNVMGFAVMKTKDKEDYDERLRKEFESLEEED
ncbi:hypothetical protein L228DRAFT_211288 [Xylona heveae TC161]|uniref:Aminoglycoside phosphotransferase domain-containing protein n=1 Tax=Xylona heveae (strain CBS 132557 / TC161) TaxID=1328760 RepID=A0A165GKC2_XYLHT|nr:hypothetical protein L228DRAFT_211288 [Xylona heveae TC161]KZF22295.1 hypothetical protein L228DRAFT_211288 [Xylona heveae TC161]